MTTWKSFLTNVNDGELDACMMWQMLATISTHPKYASRTIKEIYEQHLEFAFDMFAGRKRVDESDKA